MCLRAPRLSALCRERSETQSGVALRIIEGAGQPRDGAVLILEGALKDSQVPEGT